MALAEGSGFTPPKPPKPMVSYGAPSGPYAGTPTFSGPAGPTGTEMNHPGVPTYANPGDLYQGRPAAYSGPYSMADKFMGGFTGSILDMFNPKTYPAIPGQLNWMRKHPGEAAHQMFNTPEGIGGLTAGALTLAVPGPKGAGLLKGASSAERLAETSAPSRALAHVGGDYGIPGRQSMLDAASEQGYGLGAMLRGEQPPLIQKPFSTMKTAGKNPDTPILNNLLKAQYGDFHDTLSGISGRVGGAHTKQAPDNPMEKMFFDYTGERGDLAELEDLRGDFGIENSDVHNIADTRGNTIGSLLYAPTGPNSAYAESAYIRPEFRTLSNFNRLFDPLKKFQDIETGIANPKLSALAKKLGTRHGINIRDYVGDNPDSGAGIRGVNKTPEGHTMYDYEAPINELPPLGDYRPFRLNYNYGGSL